MWIEWYIGPNYLTKCGFMTLFSFVWNFWRFFFDIKENSRKKFLLFRIIYLYFFGILTKQVCIWESLLFLVILIIHPRSRLPTGSEIFEYLSWILKWNFGKFWRIPEDFSHFRKTAQSSEVFVNFRKVLKNIEDSRTNPETSTVFETFREFPWSFEGKFIGNSQNLHD